MTAGLFTAALLATSPPGAAGVPTMKALGLSWKRPPALSDMARFYPPGARGAGVLRGTATVHCTPDADGRLDCEAVEQWPEPWKFGRSAVTVMEKAEVASTSGSPAGKTFAFTLRFGDWTDLARARTAPPAPGLAWDAPPTLNLADIRGLTKGRHEAGADCLTAADGSLSCTPTGADAAFSRAVANSLAKARVRATDNAPVAGRTFRYRTAMVQQ